MTKPLSGWRKTVVTEHRTAIDWAKQIQPLLDGDYAEAEKVILLCDQLNSHKIACLYQAFEPTVARKLVERLEIHHTPKHDIWVNIAENELSALTRQCPILRLENKPQRLGILTAIRLKSLSIGNLPLLMPALHSRVSTHKFKIDISLGILNS